MNRRSFALIGTLGPALLLVAALASQYIGGLAPCELCIWQRWPHLAAIALGAGFLLTGRRLFGALAAASLVVGAGIAAYHVGVEQQWWAGPGACSGAGLGEMTGSQLLDITVADVIVRCDEVAWSMFGLSMAAWNGLLSVCIAAGWGAALVPGSTGSGRADR